MGDAEPGIDDVLTEINAAPSLAALDELRVQWLGKKGRLTEELKAL